MGGRDSSYTPVSTMERYDRQQDSWTAASASMRQARCRFGACMIAGELYVTGGLSTIQASSKFATVERYNPSSNTWNSVAAMPQARYSHEACEIGEAMYVIGGDLQHTWKYDAATDTWSEVAPMPALRKYSAVCAIGSVIYVIGGRTQPNSNTATAEVYKYSVDSNSWSTGSPMPTANCAYLPRRVCAGRHDLRCRRPGRSKRHELRAALRPFFGHVEHSCCHVPSSCIPRRVCVGWLRICYRRV